MTAGVTPRLRHFSATGTTAEGRLTDWRSWFGAAVDVSVASFTASLPEGTADFTATADVLDVEDVSMLDLRIGPSQVAFEPVGKASPLVRLAMFHHTSGFRAAWGDGHAQVVRSGAIHLFVRSRAEWRSSSGFAVSALQVPRSLLSVDDDVLERFGGHELPFDAPFVAGLLRPLLWGGYGRLEQLARSTRAVDLRDVWVTVADLTLGSLARSPRTGTAALDVRSRRVREIVDRNIADPALSPDTIAAELGISRRSLYSLMGDDGGVARLIRDRRLERAEAILRTDRSGALRIADVGKAVGIPSAPHFARLFKRVYQRTPAEYRKHKAEPSSPAAQVTDS